MQLSSEEKAEREKRTVNNKQTQAWSLARSQVGGVIQTGVMLWFSGNQLGIWTIMSSAGALYGALSSIMSARTEFTRYEDEKGRVDTLGPLAVYLFFQLGKLYLAARKLDNIGLLPRSVGDFISATPVPAAAEISL